MLHWDVYIRPWLLMPKQRGIQAGNCRLSNYCCKKTLHFKYLRESWMHFCWRVLHKLQTVNCSFGASILSHTVVSVFCNKTKLSFYPEHFRNFKRISMEIWFHVCVMKSTIMVKICERRKKNILEISISFWYIYLEISDYNSLIFRNQELLKENESSYKTFPNIARIL